MNRLLGRLDDWLKSNRLTFYRNLLPGVTEAHEAQWEILLNDFGDEGCEVVSTAPQSLVMGNLPEPESLCF